MVVIDYLPLFDGETDKFFFLKDGYDYTTGKYYYEI